MLLTFVISLIKDFNINDLDLLEFEIYILNIKSKIFCMKCSFESALKKPRKAPCVLD